MKADRTMKTERTMNTKQAKKEKKTFYTSDRAEWRQWLRENYRSAEEIWFVFPSKASEDPALSYNDAVEEALCFGWIDTTAGKIDETHGSRRFVPRKNGNYYSRPNIERLMWLDSEGMLLPEVRERVLPFITKPYEFPKDILERLKADPVVWENYQKFSEPYKRIRVDYIEAARKRPEEFEKRLQSFLKKTREGKLIVGFGGIDKYYQ